MTARLQIRLLGGFDLTYDGERITSIERSARLQSLLAYLLLDVGRPHPRRRIAFTFWPDTTESQARTNLRKLIYQLQNALPDTTHYLEIENHALQWNPASSYQLDVELLQAALQWADESPADDEAMGDIIRLYNGALLPSSSEEWLRERRRALQRRVIQALTKQAEHRELQGSFQGATEVVQHLLTLDPFQERFYRRLMRLRALVNDRNGAIRAYHKVRTMLQKEVGVPPSDMTELLYERIVTGKLLAGAEQEALRDGRLIPLIGRQLAWERVQELWSTLQPGASRCLWISGEGGIGKTRFAEELVAWGNLHGYIVARTRSYSAHGDLAYAPVAQLLRRSEVNERLAQLDDVWLSEIARIVPELLVKRPDLPQPSPLSQGERAVHFFEALCHAVLAQKHPVMLFFDDLQWCDEETFAWLHYLLRRDHRSRLLVVGAYRDDEVTADHPLREISTGLHREGQLFDLTLSPLAQEDAARLAEAVYEDSLDAAARRELFKSTRGNPLFVVETMRARLNGVHYHSHVRLADASSGKLVELPPKIFSLIQHRLRKLSPPAQEVLKVAAITGRSFEDRLLSAAAHVADETIVEALTELCDRRVLREQKAGLFDFAHDKLRDVVLVQVGKAQKRLLSSQIAEAYQSVYGDQLDMAPTLATLQGEDTLVMANIYLSCVLWFLGYPQQSDEKMALAHALARERGLPINLAFVCFYQMLLSQIQHDIPAAARSADRLAGMSEEYDIGFTLVAGRVGQTYVAATRAPGSRRLIGAFQQRLALYHEHVSRLSQPFYLALQVRLLIAAQRYEEAQTALTQAASLIDSVDDRYSAGEVYRLQGDLYAVTGDGNPEDSYLQAIALTGEQEAKMLQLRAAVSLARFWQRQDRAGKAHGLLSEISDWFGERAATRELQEARELLEELQQS